MLDLNQYTSLGAALRDALERFAGEVCLIEADRERENCRLTYADFKQAALPLAAALQEVGLREDGRAAIIMTNQSKWLISAYAIFYGGGVIVPLDYKLTAAEHLQLLAHSRARFLIVEYHLWRAIMAAPGFRDLKTEFVLVTEAPPKADLGGRAAGRKPKAAPSRASSCAAAKTLPASSIPRALAGGLRAACSPMKTTWSSAARLLRGIPSGRACTT